MDDLLQETAGPVEVWLQAILGRGRVLRLGEEGEAGCAEIVIAERERAGRTSSAKRTSEIAS